MESRVECRHRDCRASMADEVHSASASSPNPNAMDKRKGSGTNRSTRTPILSVKLLKQQLYRRRPRNYGPEHDSYGDGRHRGTQYLGQPAKSLYRQGRNNMQRDASPMTASLCCSYTYRVATVMMAEIATIMMAERDSYGGGRRSTRLSPFTHTH